DAARFSDVARPAVDSRLLGRRLPRRQPDHDADRHARRGRRRHDAGPRQLPGDRPQRRRAARPGPLRAYLAARCQRQLAARSRLVERAVRALRRVSPSIAQPAETFMTRTLFTAAIMLAGASLLGGCRTYPDYANAFRFPILRGDVQRGQQAFVELGCNLCHTVDGIDLPDNSRLRPVTVELGGDLIFAKTYG